MNQYNLIGRFLIEHPRAELRDVVLAFPKYRINVVRGLDARENECYVKEVYLDASEAREAMERAKAAGDNDVLDVMEVTPQHVERGLDFFIASQVMKKLRQEVSRRLR
jgi:hypothetical protein